MKNFIIFALFFGFASSAKILGCFPLPSISHQFVFRQVMLELSRRGHDLTVITPNPIGINRSNYTEVDVSFLYDTRQSLNISLFSLSPELFSWRLYQAVYLIANELLSSESVNRVLNNGQFDLVFIEFFLIPGLAVLPYHFKAPFIGIASLDIEPTSHDLIGNPFNPAYTVDSFLPHSDKKTFLERVRSTIKYVFSSLMHHYYWLPKYDELVKNHFGPKTPYIADLLKNMSLVLAYTDFRSSFPFPMVPAYIQIGGGRPLHMRGPESLPKVSDSDV